MFLADNGYFDVDAKTQKRLMRRGSSHEVFENAVILNREEQKQQQQEQEKSPLKSTSGSEEAEPIREILVAGKIVVNLFGNDEFRRKEISVLRRRICPSTKTLKRFYC